MLIQYCLILQLWPPSHLMYMSNIENFIEKYNVQFPNWTGAINSFKYLLEAPFEFTSTKASSIHNLAAMALGEILITITENNGAPMEWQEPTSRPILNGIQSELISKDFQTSFILNLDEEGISIESAILNPRNLRKMKDDFWIILLELLKLGDFEFIENEQFSDLVMSKHPKFFKGKTKGNIFRLMRNYFISEIELDECIDLGSYSVKWPIEMSVDKLLIKGNTAYLLIQKLNKLLA